MIGLPTETYEDLDEIANLIKKIVEVYYSVPKEQRAKGLSIHASSSTFVPKPFTPFQYASFNSLEEIVKKQFYLKDKLKHKNIKFSYHNAKTSLLEAIIARGDRAIGKAIFTAWKKGCKFDSWEEFFDFDKWTAAFLEEGIEFSDYTTRKRDLGEIFPWEHIDIGISKEFLKREYKNAIAEKTTPNCREKCAYCGIGEICHEHQNQI